MWACYQWLLQVLILGDALNWHNLSFKVFIQNFRTLLIKMRTFVSSRSNMHTLNLGVRKLNSRAMPILGHACWEVPWTTIATSSANPKNDGLEEHFSAPSATIWTRGGVAQLHHSTDNLLFSYISVHINIIIFVDRSMKKFFQKVRVNLRTSWSLRTWELSKGTLYRLSWLYFVHGIDHCQS